MNIDTVAGEGTNLKGRFKESLGDAVGDRELQRDGAADQVSGSTRKAIGALRDFARDQPVVAAAVALVVGWALLGGLRGDTRR
ncbi:MAG: hypothetical protein AVDCRST_MAG23-1657 [uncultured Sphingosinicella sp.]|uniref:CsbD-like domain-containing protein n=1 Tax=uncultured Sphingosinicella sp. TaxID=478748 RepID=A0A6J4U1Z5_9SPHN|nr:CsbD family protein [uncultured Sphingosinicella sp.]CAA9538516.1 MAG: hypothetical protein AVDCRST_MAG23-1657 [uncultured Sphingosinicella sp.]